VGAVVSSDDRTGLPGKQDASESVEVPAVATETRVLMCSVQNLVPSEKMLAWSRYIRTYEYIHRVEYCYRECNNAEC